ncbi:MAG: pyrroline-5-carboxylate reductase, partial [Flavobacteriaceae bacterium]
MKITIIGTGNIGLSIAKGLVINNTYTTLYLTKRKLEALSSWKEYKNITLTT